MRRENPASERRGEALIFLVAAGTLLYLAVMISTPRWLIGTPEYQWPVLRHGDFSRLPAALLILGLASGVGLFLVLEIDQLLAGRGGRWRVYAGFFLLGLAFQLGPAAVHRMGLIELPLRVYLPDHTSYFTDAVRLGDPETWLPSFHLRVQELATHSRTHPPGAILVCWAGQRLMERLPGLSAAYARVMPRSEEAINSFHLNEAELAAGGFLALILLVVAGATVPLTFSLGRMMMKDQAAAMASLLFAASPAFAHKTPILDHALGFLILLAAWLSLSGVVKKQIFRVAMAGALLGAGLWLGTSLLAGFPLCALFLAAGCYRFRDPRRPWRRTAILILLLLGLMGMSAFLATAGLGLLFDLNFLEVYRAITEVGWKLNNSLSGRHQVWMWIAFNPYEVLAWAGFPLSAFFLLALAEAIRRSLRREGGEVNPWPVVILIFLLALDLSGKVCYEASRLAWFSFPLLALTAAPKLILSEKSRQGFRLGLVLGLQVVSTLVFRMIF